MKLLEEIVKTSKVTNKLLAEMQTLMNRLNKQLFWTNIINVATILAIALLWALGK